MSDDKLRPPLDWGLRQMLAGGLGASAEARLLKMNQKLKENDDAEKSREKGRSCDSR